MLDVFSLFLITYDIVSYRRTFLFSGQINYFYQQFLTKIADLRAVCSHKMNSEVLFVVKENRLE